MVRQKREISARYGVCIPSFYIPQGGKGRGGKGGGGIKAWYVDSVQQEENRGMKNKQNMLRKLFCKLTGSSYKILSLTKWMDGQINKRHVKAIYKICGANCGQVLFVKCLLFFLQFLCMQEKLKKKQKKPVENTLVASTNIHCLHK